MSVQALSIDAFSKDELADAYEMCVANQEEFLSDTPHGRQLRQEALNHFKERYPSC